MARWDRRMGSQDIAKMIFGSGCRTRLRRRSGRVERLAILRIRLRGCWADWRVVAADLEDLEADGGLVAAEAAAVVEAVVAAGFGDSILRSRMERFSIRGATGRWMRRIF